VKYLFIIGLLFSITAKAQDGNHFYKHMEGQINSNIYMVADLLCVDNKLNGSYYYYYDLASQDGEETHFGKTIPINGSIDSEKNFEFREFGMQGDGSVYEGRFTETHRMEGMWKNSDGSRQLPFQLEESYMEGSLPFNVYYMKETFPLFHDREEPNAKLEMTLLLPGTHMHTVATDSIKNNIIENFFKKTLDTVSPLQMMDIEKELYFKQYQSANLDIYDEGSSFNWEKIKSVKVHFNELEFLTLEYYDYGYTGGAHGLPISRFSVIDLITGEKLLLDNVFKQGYQLDLQDIINEQIRTKYELDPGQNLKDAGFFVSSVEPTENFYINKDGIGFYYNRYEIAPFALGSVDIFIPYSKIRNLIRNDGALRKLLAVR
jgi:hypothetical protein